MDINKLGGPQQPLKTSHDEQLTPVQQQALKKLHEADTQFEGVFLQMLMSAMRATVPQDSVFGKESQAEQTWQDMLDSERSQAIATSGTFGIAQQLDAQLRNAVLSDAQVEAHTSIDKRTEP